MCCAALATGSWEEEKRFSDITHSHISGFCFYWWRKGKGPIKAPGAKRPKNGGPLRPGAPRSHYAEEEKEEEEQIARISEKCRILSLFSLQVLCVALDRTHTGLIPFQFNIDFAPGAWKYEHGGPKMTSYVNIYYDMVAVVLCKEFRRMKEPDRMYTHRLIHLT